MIEISEIEIKSMTKEQNYMRGYKDGKSDMLDKIRAEIVGGIMNNIVSVVCIALWGICIIITIINMLG